MDADNFEAAIAQFSKAVELHDKPWRAKYRLALYYEAFEDYTTAIDWQ